MKADVPRPRKLRIPKWVPESIARIKTEVESGLSPLPPDRLLPLLQDRRMRNVWKTLLSRQRDGSFRYPASACVPATSTEERQAAAMAGLLRYVLSITGCGRTVITRSEAEQKRNRFLAKAEELRADAEIWLRDAPTDTPFGDWRNDPRPDTCWRRLRDASEAYKQMAAETYAADTRIALERAHGDGHMRWFALAVADRCHSLFGTPLYGVTATITSVALGRRVGRRSVRTYADKAPQKTSLTA